MNKNNDLDDNIDLSYDDLIENLSDKDILEKISSFSSENLANIIVCYKYIGMYKDIFIAAMQELAKRRGDGEVFDFESYIESSLKELPDIGVKITNFSGFINLNEIAFFGKQKQ